MRVAGRAVRGRRVVLGVALVLSVLSVLLAACTATVAGTGHVDVAADGLPGGVSTPGPNATGPLVPSPAVPSAAPGPAQVDCPTVRDPQDGIAFRCITSGLTQSDDLVWSLNLAKNVETGWVLAEGATSIPVGAQISLQQVTSVVREEMIALQSWGPSPGVRTLSDSARTVAGGSGWVLETQFTISSAFRTQQKLSVRTERTWIVALRLDDSRVALWYVTLPDQVEDLWAKVPAAIDSITRI